jgi:hypothetical protein
LIDNIRSPQAANLPQVSSVEAYKFLPGQYVVMKISTGENEGLVVPTSAIIWREGRAQVWKSGSAQSFSDQSKYQCPMHPEVFSDKPGICPKCGMNLEPIKRATQSAPGKAVHMHHAS